MTIFRQLVPRMLLVVGLAAIMSAIEPGRVLSGPTDSLEKVKSISESHTEPILDGYGEVVGLKTTTRRGFSSTDTETYTSGPYAGSIISHTHDATGQRTSTTIKNPDGSGSTEKVDGKNDVVTVTDKNGQLVSTTTTTQDGTGGITRTTTDAKTGIVTTAAVDAGGKEVVTIKDKNGQLVSTTTTTPGEKGAYTRVTVDATSGNVTSEVKYPGGKDVVVVKDKNGNIVSTTTTTPNGKGGSTVVITDKDGKVVSARAIDSKGVYSVLSKSKKKTPMAAPDPSSGASKVRKAAFLGNGSQKITDKGVSEAFSQNKGKLQQLDSGSTSGSSGSSGQMQHHRGH